MTKEQYVLQLERQLAQYEGHIADIVGNYEQIIDELLGEGLPMDEVIHRLGTPPMLAIEIAEEFKLVYKVETRLSFGAKIGWIIFFIFFGLPLLMTLFSMIFAMMITIAAILFTLVIMAFTSLATMIMVWFDGDLTNVTKIIAFFTSFFGSITFTLLAYFIAKLVRLLVHTLTQVVREQLYDKLFRKIARRWM